ncbi:MAG: DUF4145 domain-containing protein [Rickettsiales bacterium]|nr:DUF4145 domain-containing protein [Rickettsiales bacterium]
MEKKYAFPSVELTAFHCPHCHTKTPHLWFDCYGEQIRDEGGVPELNNVKDIEGLINRIKEEAGDDALDDITQKRWLDDAVLSESGELLPRQTEKPPNCNYKLGNVFFSLCREPSCGKAALWIHDKLVNPFNDVEVPPNEAMPKEIKAIYNEARQVHNISPSAAAALLRLCCEKLCEYLEAKGNTLNDKIDDLVKNGLDSDIQEALDIVRVIGNEAVHPGQIDLNDNRDISGALFELINEVVEELIAKPKKKKFLFNERLPENVRKKIDARKKAARD